MYILICKEGEYYIEYKNGKFIEFKDYEKYKWLGLVYPYMCILEQNINLKKPALLMLSYDTKMRLQYRYNEYHINQSQESKVKYVKIMIKNLKSAMTEIDKDINNKKDDFKMILALMSLITYKTGIRIGKDIHFKNYNSIGLSTLMKKNLQFKNEECILTFIGKKGVSYKYNINDQIIVKNLKQLYMKCKNETDFIFRTNDDRKITYIDFNEYLKDIFKSDVISGKDFRTLLANVLFLNHFLQNKNDMSIDVKIRDSVKYVASNLQNTNSVSKKSYIFSMIIQFIKEKGITKIKNMNILDALEYIFLST